MSKIIGNTTTTPTPRSDWSQTDATKADFIKNKPTLGTIAGKNANDYYTKEGVELYTDTAVDGALKDAKAYADTKVANLVDSAPDTLNTLNELAAALGDDKNFSTTVATQIGEKADAADLTSHTNNGNIHVTAAKKTNWDTAYTHSQTTHAPSGAQANVIETIKVNGTALTPSSKAVNITVPTNYLVAADIANKADKATTLAGYGITNAYTKTEVDTAVAGKAPNSHASTATTYGTGSSSNYGHVKLSDSTSSTSSTNGGVAATPAAVKVAYDLANGKADADHDHAIADVSGLQTALDSKQATITGGATTITDSNLTASRALISNSSGKVAVSAVTSTELGYLDGVSSNVQTQLDGKSNTGHNHICYGVCSTAADTAAKTVTVNNFSLVEGATVIVKFTNANSIASPTLNVNGTGAKPIYRYGTTAASTSTTVSGWVAGAVQMFTYDGTGWIRDYWSNTTYTNVALGQGYATCSTAEATIAKVGTLSSYTLTANGIVSVKFTNAVPASATLNINSKGAKNIYYKGAAITAGVIKAGDVATFIYSSQYHLIAIDRWGTEIDNHIANTTAHITATERTNWNAAKTHADSAHAPSNAQPNQNAFSNVTVGSTTIAADSATDTLTLVAGSNITLTPDATDDKITIAATDTKYTHPTTSGNKHIPSGGSSGQILRWSADGTAAWGADNNTTYGVVSTTADGLAPKRDGSTTKFLRADGTWAVPPDNDTVYTHPAYTARTGVPTANQTPAFGGTFTVNQVNSDATGHVTAATSRTITIPSTAASASAAGLVNTGTQTFAGTKTFNSQITASGGVKIGNATLSYNTTDDALVISFT